MGDRIIMKKDSGETLEIIAIREVGVGQMIGNINVITGVTKEVLVTID